MLFMKTTVALGKLRGKKTVFTFGKGNYLEENVLGNFQYALGGFLSKREVVSFGKGNGFSGGYGTLKLEPGCTKDRIVSSYADTSPRSLRLLRVQRAVRTRGAGQPAPRGHYH